MDNFTGMRTVSGIRTQNYSQLNNSTITRTNFGELMENEFGMEIGSGNKWM